MFEIKSYAVIKNNKIVRVYDTADGEEGARISAQNEEVTYDSIVEFPVGKEVYQDEDVREFVDNNVTKEKRPLFDRVKDGYVTLTKEETVDKETDKIRLKTLKEKIEDGTKVLEPSEKYDAEKDQIISKPWSERIQESLSTYEQWLDEVVRPQRNSLLSDCDLVHCNPERWWSYSEDEKQAWSEYKQALRDFPENELVVVDSAEEIVWPVKPV